MGAALAAASRDTAPRTLRYPDGLGENKKYPSPLSISFTYVLGFCFCDEGTIFVGFALVAWCES
jgi:hypothetical protein